ncbi:carboxyltransferase domain-containing protein [Methylobacterium sp. J-077]|uniref:carboxyltransferase domain-containing protein n=1 Tax=Methylobacterium sp. J-077 TaxID=2836656 RepID=UPI00391885C4
MPRRASPRPPHPRNALVAGGGLAAIATVPMPTGWYVAGATPSRLYAPERAESFFVAAGDAIRFELVDAATLDALAARGSEGRRCMSALIVEAVGPAITLQDGGRHCTLR